MGNTQCSTDNWLLDFCTFLALTRLHPNPPPHGSSPNFCSHSFSVFFPPCITFLHCISPEVMYHWLPSSKNWVFWDRDGGDSSASDKNSLTLIQTHAHTRPHNAHSFCFKHVNCFPSVLDAQPWKSSYHLWRSSAGSKGIPELKPGLKHVNLSPLFRSFKPLTAKHNPVQLFQPRECGGSVCCR